ncbi:MAG: Coenzyme F420 hydrogenase/dehydrogenase, beta subunit C-terminal domain [Thermoplasmata archaeon]
MSSVRVEVMDGDFNRALASSLSVLLDKGIVDALVIPQESPHGPAIHQTLVRKREGLKSPRPINLLMANNAARFLQELSEADPGARVAAVLRPCELRAAVELVKLNQINRASMFFIGVDCPGTMKPRAYEKRAAEIKREGRDPSAELIGKDEPESQRETCRACERFWPLEGTADLVVAHIGLDPFKELFIEAHSDAGAGALRALTEAGYREAVVPEARRSAIQERLARVAEFRKGWLEEARNKFGSLDALLSTLSGCVRCYNCRDACPICYCKECVFDAEFMEPSPRHTLRRAGRRGLLRLPQDTLLFHLTRLNHMATSCVGCGMCEEACPQEIPVALLFIPLGERVQRLFDYVPGRDPREPLPLATFKEKELEEVGGE